MFTRLLIDVKTGQGIPYYLLYIVNSVSTYSIHYPLSLYRWPPNLSFIIKMLFRKYLARGNTPTKPHEPGAFSQSLLLTVLKQQSLTFHSWNQSILVFPSYLLQSFSVSNHFILFSNDVAFLKTLILNILSSFSLLAFILLPNFKYYLRILVGNFQISSSNPFLRVKIIIIHFLPSFGHSTNFYCQLHVWYTSVRNVFQNLVWESLSSRSREAKRKAK